MFAAPSRQGAPLLVARPDRASFLVAAPDAVLEVDGLGASPVLLGRMPCGGRVVQLGVSVSSETGQASLAVVLESGLMEVWDLSRGCGARGLLQVVPVPNQQKLLKGVTAKDGSATAAPSVHILSTSGVGVSVRTQRLDAVDTSRKKTPVVALACHGSRRLLTVCFADGVLHMYDTSRLQQGAGALASGEGAGDAQLLVLDEAEEHDGEVGGWEDDAASEAGYDEGEEDGTNLSAVKMTKAQRQLLLVPMAALKFGAGLQGVPSCLAFSPGPDFLLAGTTGGQLAVWSISRALHTMSPPQHQASSKVTLAKLMREDNAAPPLFCCAIPARASTGGVAVAVADFVGGGSPFVLAAVRDAVARCRRSSASRLQERRRSRGSMVMGVGDDGDDDEDDDDIGSGRGADGKETVEPVQYKAARLVVLVMGAEGLAVLGASQPVAEPVRMALSSGHQGRLLIAGGAGGAAFPPMRLVALPEVTNFPILGPLPGAIGPTPPSTSWSALLGPTKEIGPLALTALFLQHRLQASLPGAGGPVLMFKSMVLAQPLHALQRLCSGAASSAATSGASSTAAATPGAGAWGFLLPSMLGELTATLPSCAAQLQQLHHLGPSTLLWPQHIEVRAGLGIVACRVLSPLEQPFALLPQQQHREQDGRAGTPTVVLVVRCSPASGDEAFSLLPSPLLYAAAGRDAAFLSDTSVVVLSLDGRQVLDVQLCDGQQKRTARPILTGVEPAAYRIFGAAEQGVLLLAQGLENASTRLAMVTGATDAASGTDGQLLHAVDLQEGETVKEAAWQTGLLEHGGGPPAVPGSVLGLVTSHRVLLLAQDMTVLAAAPLVSSSPPVHHLLWLGPALLLASWGGAVAYLDIDTRSGAPSLRPLCALDHRHAGARLLAALPDRFVYAARVGASGGTQVLSRPLLPLEPLVVGALAVLPRLMQGAPEQEMQACVGAVVHAVVDRYGPACLEQASGSLYGAGEGPGANAGATGVVCMALARAGFLELAAYLAGVGAERSSYPKRPWVPPAVKGGLAAGPSGRHWMAALVEALGDDPAAREYALNPTALSSAALPPRHRRLSHVLAALGEGARRSGHAEAALRLLDVAGEDEAVVSLLVLHLVGHGPGPASEDRAVLLRELFALKADPHVLALAEAMWPEWRGAERNSGGGSEAITAALVGAQLASQAFPSAVQRRSALLPLLPVGRELPSWRQQAVAGDARLAATSGQGVSKGPPRAGLLRRLLLDRVEEWLGRGAPGGVSDDEEDAAHGGEGPGGPTGATVGEGEAASTAAWVKGVGQGREDEDNVVLYYRFGEMAPLNPSSPGAEGSQPPPSLQGDISPYGYALEVVGAVNFEPSTCPMDPGDEGKVRPAMDAVWRGAGQQQGGGSGLRFCVPRGSALDLGPYHASGPRTKLTVEMWTQRPEGGGASGAGYEVLLRRRTSEDGQPSVALWSFGIAADGALALWTGDEAAASEGRGTRICTAAGTVPDGRWTHVAFTLEAKGSVEVVLFVGGKPATTSAQLCVSALDEARLRSTVLEVGPNLGAGHRLTELRVWALLRHADDLYDNRESYLKLAEKRKRLAFKIKGDRVTPPPGEKVAASSTTAGGASLLCQSPPPTKVALGMAPPPPVASAAARRRGLTPPPGKQAATQAAEGLQAPPTLLPAPNLRRPPSARRASPTQVVEVAASAISCGTETPPASSASIPPSPCSSAATPPPPAVAGGWVSGFESWGEDPSSSSTAAISAPAPALATSPPPTAAPPQAHAQLVLRPRDLGVDAAHVLRDPMLAPAFSPHGHFLCFRERSPATEPQSAIVVLALSGPGAPRRMRYPFQADSAILVEGPGDAAETAPLIACATGGGGGEAGGGVVGALSVYDLAQRKGVARQPAATQIVHWRWLAPRQLALITARAVFYWTLPAAGAEPPSKLFERRDGAAPRVRAYHEAGGFGLLLSDDAEQEGGVVAQLFDRKQAQLYLESGGGLVGAGVGRCGCAESPLWLVAVRRDPDGAAVRLELYDLAVAGRGSSAPGSEPSGPACSEPRPLFASLSKRAEVTLLAPAASTPPVWVFFPKDGTDRGAVNVVFGGGGQGGLLASWRPPSGVGRGSGGEVTVAHPLVPVPGAVVADACVDVHGDLLVLLEGVLSVWQVPLH